MALIKAGIYHNPTLGLITMSSGDGNWITIADKNLGATTVYNDGDTLSEANCGKYYQWGNNYGFPWTGELTKASSTQVNASSYGPGNYYSSDTFLTRGSYESDLSRDSSYNKNLRGGVTGTNAAMQGPCQSGFHVPDYNGMNAVREIGISLGAWTASSWDGMLNILKLPKAGRRSGYTAASYNPTNQGTLGVYWLSTAGDGGSAYVLWAHTAYKEFITTANIGGLSIRPFANTSVEPDSSWTVLYGEEFQQIRIIKKFYHMGVEYKIKGGKPTPSYKTYTVTFDQVSDPTQRNPVYSDDAVGLTAGSTEFDTFFGYSGVRLNGSGVETASVTQTESGGAGKLNITKLGTLTSGDNVMIKFPLRGVKMSTSGTKVTLSITDDPNKEGYQYYAFTKDGDINNPGAPKSCFYLGAYLSSSDGAKSLSGATPTGNKTQGEFITAAKTNGTNYNIMSFYQREYINALYMMKYGNPDSQTVIGKGYTNSSNTAAKATGDTNSSTNSSYGTTSDTVQAKLFGLEDWWGNMYQWCGGMYTGGDKTLYTKLWDYDGTAAGGVSTGTIIQHTGSNYCLSAISGDNKAMFMPTATVSNSRYNTYRSDYAYVSASCLALVGGVWYYGSIAGAFCVDVHASASGSYSDIGSRLCFLGA